MVVPQAAYSRFNSVSYIIQMSPSSAYTHHVEPRHSKSASKGAQYLLLRAASHDTVAAATADCDLSVAFTRWVPSGRSIASYDLAALMAHPTLQVGRRKGEGGGCRRRDIRGLLRAGGVIYCF